MIFLLSCSVSYQTLRTKTTVQTFPVSIRQEDLTLQYQQAQIKVVETKASKRSKKTTNNIWTLSPYPRPVAVEQAKSFTNPIDIQVLSSPQVETVRTLSIAKPQTLLKEVYGQTASISGPTERLSSDLLILRTQLNNSNGGDIVTWSSSISPAPCPIKIENFSCTPPKYNIAHKQQHTSTLDSFAYTQLALNISHVPVPIHIQSTIENTKEKSEHKTLIHPASIYVGLSAPYWSEVDKPVLVQTKIVETNGAIGEAKELSLHLIGGSTIQHCNTTPCTFQPDRTGWHQIIATASDYQGRKTQSTSSIFIYGQNKTDQAEILLHPQKKELLVQGAKEHTDLMLGYLAADEIFLDSHSIKDGFVIQESSDDIERAKALLIGTKKTELILESEPIEEDKKTQPTKSAALLFENFQVSYPQNMYLNDSSTLYLLLPPGEEFVLTVTSEQQRIAFSTEKMRIAKRTAPSLLQIPFQAQGFGFDHILLQTQTEKKKLPITIRTSINQNPKIQYGVLKAQQNLGAQVSIPAGNYSIGTDTHAEHRLLQYVYPYLHTIPTVRNRMERIQVVSQCWDALFHNQESMSLSLMEQSKRDVEYAQKHWQDFDQNTLLHWLHTLVVMNQSALYVPTEHVWNVYQAIQKASFSDEEKAFLYFILARAQKTPLKGIIETPPKKDIQNLFSRLSDIDRIWLIPALERDNPTRHWTYSNYERIKKTAPERVMMAFFRMREYRYRIRYLREVTPLNTHEALLAQLQHARDRRLNRYSIHAFLWENQKVIERGGHRRRAHHPIVQQGNSTEERTLTLTAKGEGKLRYTISTIPPLSYADSKGSFVQQSYEENERGTYLVITFDAPQKGAYWIVDQIPGGVVLTIEEEDWLSEIQLENQELLIKTKELEPGRYEVRIPAHKKYKGTYQDPSVRIGLEETWIAKSANSTITID